MKTVMQDEKIKFQVIFYDKEPAQGGIPIDPDYCLHTWQTVHEFHHHVNKIELFENGEFPAGTYFFQIVDALTNFEVFGYASEADRIAAVPGTELVKTGPLPYGVYQDFEFISVNPAFTGKISITFPTTHNNFWNIINDAKARLTGPVVFLENGIWPVATEFYFRIIDTGIGYRGEIYSDPARTVQIASLADIGYEEVEPWNVVDLSGIYSGAISKATFEFPGDFHNWAKVSGDPSGFVTDFTLLFNSLWPLQDTFYCQIEDDGWGTQYVVKVYLSDADRLAGINQVAQTNPLDYGVAYIDEPLNPIVAGYFGTISINYPGVTHYWQIFSTGDVSVSNVSFFEGANPPPLTQATYYGRIIDGGSGTFQIAFYLNDADRLADVNRIAESANLSIPSGLLTAETLSPVGGSPFSGWIDVDKPLGGDEYFEITDPGWGGQKIPFDMFDSGFAGGVDEDFEIKNWGGVENFEIQDIGMTEPTYQIWDENNALAVDETIFPTRVAVGTFEAEYTVPEAATPGENWRFVARGKISGADTFITVPFRVVDKDEIIEEAADIVTLSETKVFLEIEHEHDDLFVSQLIGAASKTVENFTGTLFHIEDVVGLFDGMNRDTLHISPGPVNEILKVEFREGTTWSERALQGYMADGFFIQKIDDGVFDEGRRNWRITYKAGYDRADRQIRLATKMLVKFWYHTKDRTGVTSDVVGGGLRVNYQEVTDEIPPEVKQILKPYRRFV